MWSQTMQDLCRTHLAVINKVRGAALPGALILATIPEKVRTKQEKKVRK